MEPSPGCSADAAEAGRPRACAEAGIGDGGGGLAELPAAPAKQVYSAGAESTHECLLAYTDFCFLLIAIVAQ